MAVKIFGHSFSTPAAVAIGGGSLVAVWFAWKQHKASSASSASNPSAIDPVTGLPYSQDNQIDPLTGMAYLAEAQEYGSVAAAEQATAGEASTQLSGAADSGLSNLTGSSAGTSLEAVPGGYSSNAAWAQAVTAGLSDIGYTSTDVSAALGLYLGSLPLSTLADGVSSASIVSAALAEYGPPPVGTFTMIAASPTTTAAAGTTSTGTTTTGTGDTGSATTTSGSATTTAPAASAPAPAVARAGAISNLHVNGYNQTGVTFEWNRAPGDTGGYAWALTSVDGQGISKSGNLPSGSTVHSVTGLTKAGVYNFGIQALPGGPGNNIHTPSLKG